MWTDDELRGLKQRISQMADSELLRMVNQESADYRAEALDLARSELAQRGNPTDQSRGGLSETIAPAYAGAPCSCGGQWRSGLLFADQEMTIVFSDTQEERFVKVVGCSRCGQLRLMVDLETDVEES